MRVLIIAALIAVLGLIVWSAMRQGDVPTPPPVGTPVGPGETPAKIEPALPSFDIVYVTRDGDATIAGRAKPGAKVRVYANGEELASTTAIEDGSWTLDSPTPLAAGPVELSLDMTTTDGQTIRSDQTVIIYVPQRAGDRPLVVRTTPGGPSVVLQDPTEEAAGLGPLSLDVIDYDDSGAVIFSGRAEPGRVVQLFVNKQFLAEATSDPQGRWMISPAQAIAPGVYALTVVQLDENGRPKYAIELPFERARPEDIDLRDGKVIVQPGNSLWRIARRAYGKGAQYTVIYEANADQIRDPDLIYPGQIFTVPETEDQKKPEESGG
ncbi:MAG: Ig-like domain-containing protein [Parvularculaceae bacterium]